MHRQRRARAFEFVRSVAMSLAEKAKTNPLKVGPEPSAPFKENDRVQLTEEARKAWPWAPEGQAKVLICSNGWTRLDYPDRNLTAPNAYLEPAAVAEKASV